MTLWEKFVWLNQFTAQEKIEMTQKIMESLPEIDSKTGEYVVSALGGEQQNSAEV